jgi:hypothetical protein
MISAIGLVASFISASAVAAIRAASFDVCQGLGCDIIHDVVELVAKHAHNSIYIQFLEVHICPASICDDRSGETSEIDGKRLAFCLAVDALFSMSNISLVTGTDPVDERLSSFRHRFTVCFSEFVQSGG